MIWWFIFYHMIYFSTELDLYWFKKIKKKLASFYWSLDLWTEINFSAVSGVAKYDVYLNNSYGSWYLITSPTFWQPIAQSVVLQYCFSLFVLFSELGCGSLQYRDLVLFLCIFSSIWDITLDICAWYLPLYLFQRVLERRNVYHWHNCIFSRTLRRLWSVNSTHPEGNN